VEDNHNAAVAPAAYVITVDLFSVSSHLSAMVVRTSSVLNFSARAIVCARRWVKEACARGGTRTRHRQSPPFASPRARIAFIRRADDSELFARFLKIHPILGVSASVVHRRGVAANRDVVAPRARPVEPRPFSRETRARASSAPRASSSGSS